MKAVNNRRIVLKAGAGLMLAPMLGNLAACSGKAEALPTQALNDRVTLISGAPGNILALTTGEGYLLVDSGSVELGPSVQASLEEMSPGAAVSTVINTHYHHDQTGANALFGEAGATIVAHTITRQWLSSKYYVPLEDSWVPALPERGRPVETFREKRDMTADQENIELGYLLEAHTRGDIYVYLKDSNILAVGDVVSPLRDPALDWYAGAWIGGRVDAMDDLLEVANTDTLIVPAYGPVMTYADMQAERDMMNHLYERTTGLTVKGHSAQDMLDVGLMDEIERKFEDPYRFLYDVAKGNWAHYTNFGGQTV